MVVERGHGVLLLIVAVVRLVPDLPLILRVEGRAPVEPR
jgi:hypothetical protein